MREVEVGTMPTSLRVAGVYLELDFEQGAMWEGTCDGEGGGVRFVDTRRGRKRSFTGKASNLVKRKNGWEAAMTIVPKSLPDTVTRGSRFGARSPYITTWIVICWCVLGELAHGGDPCCCIHRRQTKADGE